MLTPILAVLAQLPPTLISGWDHWWRISDDGACLAFGAGREIWRVRDWKYLGKNPIYLSYDDATDRAHTLDISQNAHFVRKGRGWHWEDDFTDFCLRSEKLWSTLHNAERIAANRTHFPERSQLVSFVHRDRRGQDPNREVLVRARIGVGQVASTLAFRDDSTIDLAEVALPKSPAVEFLSWSVAENGTVKARFRRKHSLKGLAPKGYWRVNVAFSVDRLATRYAASPDRFQILHGPTGKITSVQLPPGADVAWTVVAKNDLLVHSPAKRATLRYSFSTKNGRRSPSLRSCAYRATAATSHSPGSAIAGQW
jgi:hypothetical protein